jgi:hypothetical protein
MRVTFYLAGPEVEAVGPYHELDRREVEAIDDMTVTSVLAAGEGPEEEMLVYSFFVPLSEATRTGVALDDPAGLQAALNLFGVRSARPDEGTSCAWGAAGANEFIGHPDECDVVVLGDPA